MEVYSRLSVYGFHRTEKKAGSMKQQGRGGTEVEQTISDTNYLFYGERGEGPQR